MHYLSALPLLFSATALAAPLSTDTAEPCIPTSYTISNYVLSTDADPASASLSLAFNSHFNNPAIINDPASAGATCTANALANELPNEMECSTGRRNLLLYLAGPTGSGKYQLIHDWRCNGQEWMSSTRLEFGPTATQCSVDQTTGKKTCVLTNGLQEVVPQNSRRICNAPTCQ